MSKPLDKAAKILRKEIRKILITGNSTEPVLPIPEPEMGESEYAPKPVSWWRFGDRVL